MMMPKRTDIVNRCAANDWRIATMLVPSALERSGSGQLEEAMSALARLRQLAG